MTSVRVFGMALSVAGAVTAQGARAEKFNIQMSYGKGQPHCIGEEAGELSATIELDPSRATIHYRASAFSGRRRGNHFSAEDPTFLRQGGRFLFQGQVVKRHIVGTWKMVTGPELLRAAPNVKNCSGAFRSPDAAR